MEDELVLPSDELEVGDEIARGANGAVHTATLYGMAVCAKVRRGAAATSGPCCMQPVVLHCARVASPLPCVSPGRVALWCA
jgi:hypothetical protein